MQVASDVASARAADDAVAEAAALPVEALARGFAAAELALLQSRARAQSAAVLYDNRDALEWIVARTWRMLTRLWAPWCRELTALGVPVAELRRLKRALEYPAHSFDWTRSTVESSSRHHLGGARVIAVDVVWFLTQIEGKRLRSGPQLPKDLLERYLLSCACERTLSADPARLRQVIDGRDGALGVALRAFLDFKQGDAVNPAAPEGERDTAPRETAPRETADAEGAVPSRRVPRLFALGQRAWLLFSLLLGVPIELPFRRLGTEARVLEREARWLAAFLGEKPRTNNTPGSHLACGIIAVKRTLKHLALRRERADASFTLWLRRRTEVVRARNRAAERVYECLLSDPAAAGEQSRREHDLARELARLDDQLLDRRLELQAEVVASFARAFAEQRRAGRVSQSAYDRARAELEQPANEPPALLPMGLIRSPAVWAFEYGMFLGRVALAVAFVTTFQVSWLGWGVLLFALNLYVVEPVVFKLQMSAIGRFTEVSGHKLVDLRRYMESELPDGAVFRLPITVPKFSSNPAWTNLNAIIQAALTRSLTTSFTVVPFAMRSGRKSVSIELPGGAERDVAARAAALCEALRQELKESRAKFPLATRVAAEGRRVTIHLTDDDATVWAMIGEDASQAFIYLWRNLRALQDTLSYLGERFQPVFILASNTEDPDAIELELCEIQKLQAWSDREYGGQVGFLYLLRGGEWCSYNSRLERFDEKDKTFARATRHFKERLSDPATPAREHLLRRLIQTLEPKQLATAFNATLGDPEFYREFDGFGFERLPAHAALNDETLRLLARRRAGESLPSGELTQLNRELLLTALPMRVRGAFFKKVGNDIAVQELLVAGRTRPTTYVDRRVQEHVQDPTAPNYARVWGDFSRYTGLAGSTAEIQEAILEGRDLPVESVPELGAILDDKNEFAPGEIEKGLATLLHPENRHIVIGVPRIDVTLPEHQGETVASEYILGAQSARAAHNGRDGLTRVRVFAMSSPAYGKWFKRPKPYLAHYVQESLNAAHALSHDFQQSYLVAGASGRLGGFTEALYGPKRFEVRAALEPATARQPRAAQAPVSASQPETDRSRTAPVLETATGRSRTAAVPEPEPVLRTSGPGGRDRRNRAMLGRLRRACHGIVRPRGSRGRVR